MPSNRRKHDRLVQVVFEPVDRGWKGPFVFNHSATIHPKLCCQVSVIHQSLNCTSEDLRVTINKQPIETVRDCLADTPFGDCYEFGGCVPEGFMVVADILFDTNKWDIKPEGQVQLDKGAAFLLKSPQIKVEIQGHTDSSGAAAWKATLSQRRAESVMKYLVSKGVPAGQLTAKGFGPANPVAPNDTTEGRAKNRRVDFSHSK